MRRALVVALAAVAVLGPARAAIAEGLVAPREASPELRGNIQRECLGRTRRPWPYGPDAELRGAVFEGRSTNGFLVRGGEGVKAPPEEVGGVLVPEARAQGGPPGDVTDRFVFCLLLSGYHWQSSDEEGVAVLRRLAESGHRAAQTTIGVAYFYGEFVKSDHNEAVRWFRRSADQGHPKGERYLGIAYANGEGVATDLQEAMRWLKKAAAHGEREAADLLGRYGKQLEQRAAPVAASEVERIRHGAEQGDRRAQVALAVLYEDGRGVERDIAEALRWYRTAAEGGSAQAQNYLGVVYEKGRGVQQDDREAVGWYRRAAEQGEPRAEYSLGVLLIKGRGAARDETQGWAWIERAAKRGHPRAQEAVRRKRMTGPRDSGDGANLAR